ncbi:hypothetical protein B5G27_07455 [Lachnoclostridium sp. An76]|nr:hypothetical protein B5G27_07455 [Lachnoclostridium sp. An76]
MQRSAAPVTEVVSRKSISSSDRVICQRAFFISVKQRSRRTCLHVRLAAPAKVLSAAFAFQDASDASASVRQSFLDTKESRGL